MFVKAQRYTYGHQDSSDQDEDQTVKGDSVFHLNWCPMHANSLMAV